MDMPTEKILNNETEEEFARNIFDISYFKSDAANPQISLFYHSRKSICQLPLLPDALEQVLRKLFKAALKLDAPLCSIELHIVNDAQMSLLNHAFMGNTGPTNILSFPGDLALAGCLILSADTFIREARLYGQDCEDYIFHLLTHGMAHLSGFEHGPEMEDFEDSLQGLCAELD